MLRKSDLANDGKPDPKPVRVLFDSEITTLIGRNGSGKSALLEALQRIFGDGRPNLPDVRRRATDSLHFSFSP